MAKTQWVPHCSSQTFRNQLWFLLLILKSTHVSPSPTLPGTPRHYSVLRNHCKALQQHFPASSLSRFGKTAKSFRGKFNFPNTTFKVFHDRFSAQFSSLVSQLHLWYCVSGTLTQLSSVSMLCSPRNSLTLCCLSLPNVKRAPTA